MTQITKKQADGILPFLDRFEQGEISAGEWQHQSGRLPWFEPSESYAEFYEALYEHGWVVPFDCMSRLGFLSDLSGRHDGVSAVR